MNNIPVNAPIALIADPKIQGRKYGYRFKNIPKLTSNNCHQKWQDIESIKLYKNTVGSAIKPPITGPMILPSPNADSHKPNARPLLLSSVISPNIDLTTPVLPFTIPHITRMKIANLYDSLIPNSVEQTAVPSNPMIIIGLRPYFSLAQLQGSEVHS
jgi:hypothetical protein